MWKKRYVIFYILLAVCLSLGLRGTCSANPTYEISETELMRLENHLTALEQNNETLKAILSESGQELTIALTALTESQTELAKLKSELQKAKVEANNAQASLQIANDELKKAAQSFRAYEIERDRTENRLRNQRNIWEFLCALAIGVAVSR